DLAHVAKQLGSDHCGGAGADGSSSFVGRRPWLLGNGHDTDGDRRCLGGGRVAGRVRASCKPERKRSQPKQLVLHRVLPFTTAESGVSVPAASSSIAAAMRWSRTAARWRVRASSTVVSVRSKSVTLLIPASYRFCVIRRLSSASATAALATSICCVAACKSAYARCTCKRMAEPARASSAELRLSANSLSSI